MSDDPIVGCLEREALVMERYHGFEHECCQVMRGAADRIRTLNSLVDKLRQEKVKLREELHEHRLQTLAGPPLATQKDTPATVKGFPDR